MIGKYERKDIYLSLYVEYEMKEFKNAVKDMKGMIEKLIFIKTL